MIFFSLGSICKTNIQWISFFSPTICPPYWPLKINFPLFCCFSCWAPPLKINRAFRAVPLKCHWKDGQLGGGLGRGEEEERKLCKFVLIKLGQFFSFSFFWFVCLTRIFLPQLLWLLLLVLWLKCIWVLWVVHVDCAATLRWWTASECVYWIDSSVFRRRMT